LAVALLDADSRRRELRLDATMGFSAVSVGLRHGIEVLPAAVAGFVAGVAVAYGVVVAVGPDGAVTSQAVTTAAVRAGALLVLAVLLIVAVTALAAWRVARPDPGRVGRARPPWEAALVVALGTALAGLLAQPDDLRPVVGLDLAIPLLMTASIGAVGAGLVTLVVGQAMRVSRSRGRPRLRSPGRAVRSLAMRRAVTAGGGAVLVITMVATGLGVALYTVLASSAVAQAVDDKVAAAAGAAATVPIDGSWLLDPAAPDLPVIEADQLPPEPEDLPPRRNPPLPAGYTVVWRDSITLPEFTGGANLLIVDPAGLDGAAQWGAGPGLSDARRALALLRDASSGQDASASSGSTTLPVIAVGAPGLARGNVLVGSTSEGPQTCRVIAVVDAFPGYGSTVPMLVINAESYLGGLGLLDPRFRDQEGAYMSAEVWGAAGQTGLVSLLASSGVDAGKLTTSAQLRERPEFVIAEAGIGYQLAIAAGIVALALIATCLYADRRASRSRASDVMLARAGLGRSGPGRARAIELVTVVFFGAALAVIGVLALVPLGRRLLDPAPKLAPALQVREDPTGYLVMIVAAVVLAVAAIAVAAARSHTDSDSAVLRDAE